MVRGCLLKFLDLYLFFQMCTYFLSTFKEIFNYIFTDSQVSNFVGGGSSRGRRQKRGEDVVHTLKVSLEDLYNGTSKKLSLSRNVMCPKCKGYVLYASFS